MCNALRLYFRRENTVRRYKAIHRFLHIKTYVCENKISSRRASNERPYGIVQTVAILRSGMICFLILQTVYTNWERRLAVLQNCANNYNAIYTNWSIYMFNITELLKNEISVWERLKNCKKPVVLYGMGDGADKVLAAFDRYGIKASAVIASDDFVRGQKFHDFTVKKLSDVETEFGDIIIALCFASQLPDVMEHITKISEKHETLVPSVPVFGNKLFDNDFITENKEQIESTYSLLADDLSKKVYENILKFYCTGRIDLLPPVTTDKDEAFGNILNLSENESYVDLGAYNGDTIDEFLHYTNGSYKRIIAFEPNAKNFEKLKLHCKGMANVSLWQLGSYSKNTELIFNNKSGRNSAISDKGVATKVATVDTILCGMAAGYIKADVEGADMETLIGMQKTMENCKPKLNFSAYHRFEDIFRLALYIHSVNPDYKIFLRHHPYIPAWDTNLYCI